MRTKKNHSNGSAEKTVKVIRREQINQNGIVTLTAQDETY